MSAKIFPITWMQALEGSRFSLENAKRLADDAQVLRQNQRFQSAFALSLTAWEEFGKAVLLFRYWKQKHNVDENEWFKVLRNHKMKRVAYVKNTDILYEKEGRPPKSVEDMRKQLEKASKEMAEHFNLEREIGVYVDWLGRWRSPSRLSTQLFSDFPFDSDYWISNVVLSASHLDNLIAEAEKVQAAAQSSLT